MSRARTNADRCRTGLLSPPIDPATLPNTRRELKQIVKRYSTMLALFMLPDSQIVVDMKAELGSERLLELGYKVGLDFFLCVFALIGRHGPELSKEALSPLKALALDQPRGAWIGPKERLMRRSISGGMMTVWAFVARGYVLKMEDEPVSLRAKIDQLLLVMASGMLGWGAPSDPELDRELREQIVLLSLRELHDGLDGVANQEMRRFKGPFSHLRIQEFPELAKRTPTAKSRYGESRIEALFEDQLALLVQSLGFLVVRARRATRRVDLVCLTADTTERYTALIEAKTRAGPIPCRQTISVRSVSTWRMFALP